MTENAINEINALYVDDEKILLDLAKIFLEHLNDDEFQIKVSIVNSAIQALRLLKEKSFDIVISDYEMPEMNGIKFLKQINENFGKNKIPFIIFTGRGREDVVIEALNNGATFYLQKGGEPTAQFQELASKIKQAVTSKRLREEKEILQEKSKKDLEKFRLLYELALLVSSDERDPQKNLQFLVEKIRELFKVDAVYIALLDKTKKNIVNYVECGLITEAYKHLVLPVGEGLGGLVMKKRTGMIIEDYLKNNSFYHSVDPIVQEEGAMSGLAAPIEILNAPPMGVLYAFTREKRKFNQEDLDMLFLLSHLTAIEIMYCEQEKAQETSQVSLIKTNKKLALMATITRHDINNQITVLNALVELLRSEDLEKDSKIKSIISMFESTIEIINKQIRFTKNYQEIGVNAPTWQSVSEITKKCWEENRKTLNSSLLAIELKNKTNGVQIYADPLLEKAINNLIDNTLRHAKKENGQKIDLISLDYRIDNNNLIISYQDNGVGIKPEDKEEIFKYGVGKGVGRNTGLGLFLIKEILEITDIEIKEAGEYGKGACFEIIVPQGKYRFGGH